MFRCCSPETPLPLLLPQSPRDCSVHLCLFFCFAYRVIINIFLNSRPLALQCRVISELTPRLTEWVLAHPKFHCFALEGADGKYQTYYVGKFEEVSGRNTCFD